MNHNTHEYHWSAGQVGGQWINAGRDFNGFLAMIEDDRRDARLMAEAHYAKWCKYAGLPHEEQP